MSMQMSVRNLNRYSKVVGIGGTRCSCCFPARGKDACVRRAAYIQEHTMRTYTIGYPVHAVKIYHSYTSPHQVLITEWEAVCGASGKAVGIRPFDSVFSALKGELCKTCWPQAHRTYHEAPREIA